MLLMTVLHLLDPLKMTRRIKLTSQNLKVIETRNTPDGTFRIAKSMLLMTVLHLLDPLKMTRRIKLTSQNLKVIETRNIPDGTPATYKKSVEEETMGCNTGKAFAYIPGLLLYRHLYLQ